MKHVEQKNCAELGKRIRDERKRQKVTQLQLAGIAGTGVRFISDLENGKETSELGKTMAVIRALGLGVFVFSPWENV